MAQIDTSKLQAMYRKAGFDVEIEAGPVGLVVYGSGPVVVNAAATSLLKIASGLDPSARVERAQREADETEQTAWYATVHLDWNAVENKVA